MELRFYLSTLFRRKWHILIITLLTVLLSSFFTVNAEPKYSGSVFFTIGFRDDIPSEDYREGHYWSHQASIEFARTLSGWPKDPNLAGAVDDRAQVDMETDLDLLGKLLGAFSTKRVERANLQISFRSKELANVERLADSLIQVITEKVIWFAEPGAHHGELPPYRGGIPYYSLLYP